MRVSSLIPLLLIALAARADEPPAKEPSAEPRQGYGGFSIGSGVRGGVTDQGDGFIAPGTTLRLWGIDLSHAIVARPELTVSLPFRDAAALFGNAGKDDIPTGVFNLGFFLGWTGTAGACGVQLGGGFDGEFAAAQSPPADQAVFTPGRFDAIRAEPGLFCKWSGAALQLAPFAAAGFRIEGQRLSMTGAAGSDLRYVSDRVRARAGFDWEGSLDREPSLRVSSAYSSVEGKVVETKYVDFMLGANARISDRKVGSSSGASSRSTAVTFGVDAGIAF